MAEEVLQREEKIRHIEIDRAKLESEKLQLESEYKTEIAKLEERSKADMERMAREHEDQVWSSKRTVSRFAPVVLDGVLGPPRLALDT